jgi:polysaccharide biosynthesis transport protein
MSFAHQPDAASQAVPTGETAHPLIQGPPRAAHALMQFPEPPPILSATPNLAGLLQAARRRWRLSLFLGVFFAAAAAAAMWYFQPEKFTARTLVHVAVNRPIILADTPEGRTDSTTYQRTQIAYVKSRRVLIAALRNPKVADLKTVKEQTDPVVWLEKEIQCDFSASPEILRIQLTGDLPQELIEIVNSVREGYLKEVLQSEKDGRQFRLDKLKEIYAVQDQKLQEKRRLLEQLAGDLGSTKDAKVMERSQELAWKAIENLFADLMQTRSKLNKAKMELAVKVREGQSPENSMPAQVIEDYVKKDKDVQKYQQDIAELDNEIERLKANLVDPVNDPAVKPKLNARKRLQTELDAHRVKLRSTLTANLRGKISEEIEAERAACQKEIASLEKQDKWLSEELDKREKSNLGMNMKRVNVEWLHGEITVLDALAQKMASQAQLLEVEMKAPERFRMMEDTFYVPDKEGRIRKAGMAGFGAFALVIFGIAFLEFRSRRVNNAEDVVRGLRIKLMGSLPTLPQRFRSSLDRPKRNEEIRWQNLMTESVEATRTMLLHAAQTEAMRVIVITSAVGGEGKTLTASHLAVSLARAGRKTLLVDADLRRPALLKLFNLQVQPGLSEVLRGEAELNAAFQEGPAPGLTILAAGISDDRAVQALSQPILDDIIAKAKEGFEFIIIDSTPVLPVADSTLLGQQADGVIFSVLQDVSRLPQVYAAYERLAALRIRILGAVVNGSRGLAGYSSYTYAQHTPPYEGT